MKLDVGCSLSVFNQDINKRGHCYFLTMNFLAIAHSTQHNLVLSVFAIFSIDSAASDSQSNEACKAVSLPLTPTFPILDISDSLYTH